MKHTSGEVEYERNYIQGTGKMGKPICSLSWDHKDASETTANAERIAALWNAFNGSSTHDALNIIQIGLAMKEALDGVPITDAVKYLEHGAEMVKAVKKSCDDCRADYAALEQLAPCCTNPKAWVCSTQTLLEKVGG